MTKAEEIANELRSYVDEWDDVDELDIKNIFYTGLNRLQDLAEGGDGDEHECDEKVRQFREWTTKIRQGDQAAIDEAIGLIREHALPEDHPMAVD